MQDTSRNLSVSNDALTRLQRLMDAAYSERRTPCAVLRAFDTSGKAISLSTGFHTYDASRHVDEHDLFDLASLTKVISTTTLTMLAVQNSCLNLDDRIDVYLLERKGLSGTQPTIRQLLAHCAGFPPFIPFHILYSDMTDIDQKRSQVIMTPLANEPQTITQYSDIGMMLLGFILERLFGKRLDQLFIEKVAKPLGMTDTQFNPPKHLHDRCVPTEIIKGSLPPKPWQGIVHDENARWLGGCAGHAGLFSTIDDLAAFAKMCLQHGGDLIDHAVFDLFTHRANLVDGSSRCLGWDSPTQPSSGGRLVGPNAFGHTGFTGTSFWVDPDAAIAVILLTNAVHPNRSAKTNYFPWRNEVHTIATKALMK